VTEQQSQQIQEVIQCKWSQASQAQAQAQASCRRSKGTSNEQAIKSNWAPKQAETTFGDCIRGSHIWRSHSAFGDLMNRHGQKFKDRMVVMVSEASMSRSNGDRALGSSEH